MGDEKPQPTAASDSDTRPGERKAEGSEEETGVERVSSRGGGAEAVAVEGGGEGGVCELVRKRALLGPSGQEVTGAGYFTGGWRGQLCRCETCVVSSVQE